MNFLAANSKESSIPYRNKSFCANLATEQRGKRAPEYRYCLLHFSLVIILFLMIGILNIILVISKLSIFIIVFTIIVVLIVLNRTLFRKYITDLIRKNEIWLPIVDDFNNIIGRVAQSVSMETPGKFQHPVIRLIVWDNGKIYLKPRDKNLFSEINMLDHPFIKRLHFGENVGDVIEKFKTENFPDCNSPKFILQYKYENTKGKWQVLLYIIDVSESSYKNNTPAGGKYWISSQIKDNVNKGLFSDIFEKELKFFNVLFDEAN